MASAAETRSPQDAMLDRLAERYVWGPASEGYRVASKILALLGREDDEAFDLDEWAIERVEVLRGVRDVSLDGPFVVRAGPYVGLAVGQWWNHPRREVITAVQTHPGERQVLVEAGIEEVERAELVELMRQELIAALTRVRFLGIDALATRLLCEEALLATTQHDYKALRVAAYDTPTLGDGEGVRQLVRVVGVELLGGYRVRLAFDDCVSRVLDLDPFLRGPALAAVRRPSTFLQLRIEDGTLRWPNGAALDATALRYLPEPALDPAGG